MILSDRSLRDAIASGAIGIDPYDPSLIQPASIDVRLGNEFLSFIVHNEVWGLPQRGQVIDSRLPMTGNMSARTIQPGKRFEIPPLHFVLGTTIETIRVPDYLCAQLNGRSSLGRLGIVIHATAGFIDPGFHGQITLEISNVSPLPVLLDPGMRIGQLTFTQLTTPCEVPYGAERGSKYQGQRGPTMSQLYLDFPEKKT